MWLLPAGLPGTVIWVLLGRLPKLPTPPEKMDTGLRRTVFVEMSPRPSDWVNLLRHGPRRKQPVLRPPLPSVRPGRIQLANLTTLIPIFLPVSPLPMVLRTLVRGMGDMFIPRAIVSSLPGVGVVVPPLLL